MKNILRIFLIFPLSLALFFSCKGDASGISNVEPSGGSGKGGSLARFTISKDFLYVVDSRNLKAYNISNAENPLYVGKTAINAYAETIFPFKDNLLVGTRSGMFIFGLSEPAKPNQLGVFQHFFSCDPVVAEGNHAYVTLRSGTPCRMGQNQLDILDISNLSNPRLVNSLPMLNPHGLGVKENILFVCEGDNGMKVFDRTNPTDLKLIKFMTDVKSIDVISVANQLVITGTDGIYQYEYNNKGEMTLLSKMSVEK